MSSPVAVAHFCTPESAFPPVTLLLAGTSPSDDPHYLVAVLLLSPSLPAARVRRLS